MWPRAWGARPAWRPAEFLFACLLLLGILAMHAGLSLPAAAAGHMEAAAAGGGHGAAAVAAPARAGDAAPTPCPGQPGNDHGGAHVGEVCLGVLRDGGAGVASAVLVLLALVPVVAPAAGPARLPGARARRRAAWPRAGPDLAFLCVSRR
jgi:hypothetical protein